MRERLPCWEQQDAVEIQIGDLRFNCAEGAQRRRRRKWKLFRRRERGGAV